MRRWLLAQFVVMTLSWLAGASIIFGLMMWLAVEAWMAGLLAVVLAGVFPVLSLFELLVRRALGGRPSVGPLDCLVSNVMVVSAPLAFGYSWVVGECLTCAAIVNLAVFSVLSAALPIAIIHGFLSRRINSNLC